MAKRLRVYVAGPYSADNVLGVLQNIGRGERACAQLLRNGFSPFCPWHDKSYAMDEQCEEVTVEDFQEHSMAWLECSQALLCIDGWEKSKGTMAEIARAKEIGIPVFYDIFSLLVWSLETNEHANG